MIKNLALILFLGKPLIIYGGILTLFLMLTTATVGVLNYRGITVVPFKWHPRLAMATIVVALVNAIFGLSIFFNF